MSNEYQTEASLALRALINKVLEHYILELQVLKV